MAPWSTSCLAARWSGSVSRRPGGRLRLEHSDGRAYARRFADHFDVIQMTGADTYAAGLVSGSILSENYLYTLEAFEDYFRALAPDGLLAITRFGIEPFKVIATAAEAIARAGVKTPPSRHVGGCPARC